jgi:hypothetical protein
MVARGGGVVDIEAIIVTPSTQTAPSLPPLPLATSSTSLPAHVIAATTTAAEKKLDDAKRVPYVVVHVHVIFHIADICQCILTFDSYAHIHMYVCR